MHLKSPAKKTNIKPHSTSPNN